MATKDKEAEPTYANIESFALAMNAIRKVLAVFESGHLNSVQRNAINQVRVLLGDVAAPGCSHDAGDFRDADDVLRCVLCHEDLGGEPVVAAIASHNETPSQDE